MLSGTPSTSFASGSSQHALRKKLLADWRQHQRNLCLRAQSSQVNTDLLMAPGDLFNYVWCWPYCRPAETASSSGKLWRQWGRIPLRNVHITAVLHLRYCKSFPGCILKCKCHAAQFKLELLRVVNCCQAKAKDLCANFCSPLIGKGVLDND